VKNWESRYAELKWCSYHRIPTTSVAVQETVSDREYDRRAPASDGCRQRSLHHDVGVLLADYFWLPNGRILRMRFNVSQSFSSNVNVEDVMFTALAQAFEGHSNQGIPSSVDAVCCAQ